jgi:hypothetical protein
MKMHVDAWPMVLELAAERVDALEGGAELSALDVGDVGAFVAVAFVDAIADIGARRLGQEAPTKAQNCEAARELLRLLAAQSVTETAGNVPEDARS